MRTEGNREKQSNSYKISCETFITATSTQPAKRRIFLAFYRLSLSRTVGPFTRGFLGRCAGGEKGRKDNSAVSGSRQKARSRELEQGETVERSRTCTSISFLFFFSFFFLGGEDWAGVQIQRARTFQSRTVAYLRPFVYLYSSNTSGGGREQVYVG